MEILYKTRFPLGVTTGLVPVCPHPWTALLLKLSPITVVLRVCRKLLTKCPPVIFDPQLWHRWLRTVSLNNLLLLLLHLYLPLLTLPWHPLSLLGQPIRGLLLANLQFPSPVSLTTLGVNVFGNPLSPFKTTLYARPLTTAYSLLFPINRTIPTKVIPPIHRSNGAIKGGHFNPGYMHLILLNSTIIKLLKSTGLPFRFPRTRPTFERIFPRLVTTEFTTLLGSLYFSSKEDTRPPAGLTKHFKKLLTNLRATSCVPTQVPTPTLGIRKFVPPNTVRIETMLGRIPFYDNGLTVILTTLVLPL